MGLFDKVKSILFEEEEVEEEVTPTENKERANIETSNKVEYKPLPVQENKANNVERVNVDVKPVEPTFEKVKAEANDFSERDLFRNESTFKFPAFDEDEFNTSMPHNNEREEKKDTTNVLDYERRKRLERKNEYSRLDSFKAKEEVKEEKKRFKPSPVISPVYGILDKDYKVEDIKEAPKNVNNNIISSKDLDVESVRAKAFGKLEDNLKTDSRRTVITHETYDIKKETVTPKHEKKEEIIEEKLDDVVISNEPILEDTKVSIEERAKTIDELLKDASDEVIDVPEEEKLDNTNSYDDLESKLEDELTISNDDALDDVIEEKEDAIFKEKTHENALEDDTLENDLYDLIDSMYDNTEEGE